MLTCSEVASLKLLPGPNAGLGWKRKYSEKARRDERRESEGGGLGKQFFYWGFDSE